MPRPYQALGARGQHRRLASHHEIEKLSDAAAYDLAWLPSFFIVVDQR
jgi:hypothetical protein